jgi:hypothetical protein
MIIESICRPFDEKRVRRPPPRPPHRQKGNHSPPGSQGCRVIEVEKHQDSRYDPQQSIMNLK